ncbi:hypothetical protein D9M72_565170 [compost metagenome]
MQFGSDEVQLLLQASALQRTVGGRQPGLRKTVGNILHDGRTLSDDVAGFQHQRRHIAFGIDRLEIGAAFGEVGRGVDLDDLKIDAGLAQADMGRERAGAGGIKKLHGQIPFAMVVSVEDGRNLTSGDNFCI